MRRSLALYFVLGICRQRCLVNKTIDRHRGGVAHNGRYMSEKRGKVRDRVRERNAGVTIGWFRSRKVQFRGHPTEHSRVERQGTYLGWMWNTVLPHKTSTFPSPRQRASWGVTVMWGVVGGLVVGCIRSCEV